MFQSRFIDSRFLFATPELHQRCGTMPTIGRQSRCNPVNTLTGLQRDRPLGSGVT